ARRPPLHPRPDERQHLPLRCVSEHRRRDRGRRVMDPFTYSRAATAEEASAAGATFLGGGTNLVDLMRLGVERPTALVDVSRLNTEIDATSAGGLRIGAGVRNSDLAADRRLRTRYPAVAQALL